MKAEDLKNSILQLAMEGKLVPQDPNDEPASVLLDKIREEKEQLIKEKKIKRNNKESFIFRKNGHFYEKIGKKGEPVCIDDEIPFEIPKNWIWYRLNVFANIIMGQSPKGEFVVDNGEGIEFHQGKLFFGEKYLNESDKSTIKPSKISPRNSILLCVRAPVGVINICDREICIGRGLTSIKPFIDDCFNYLYYFLLTQEIRYKSKATGSTFKAIKKEIVENTLIPAPPLNEQKRIVDKIEALLPLIDEYGENKEKLDRLNSKFPDKIKSSILQEAIQGKLVPQNPNDEPASVLLEKIREEKERLIKEKKIKRNKNESYIFKENNHFYEKSGKKVIDITNELPFEIPGNWLWCKLENITSNIHYGYTASAQEVGNVKLLRITDIHENNVDWDSVPYCVISEDKLANYILKNRDIVMARTGGTIGKSYIINNLNKKAVFASYLIRIIPLENINENYLKQFFESPLFWNQLRDNTKGTGQPNVNAKSLKNLLIPLPPLIEQDKIVTKTEKIFSEINLRFKV